ncbi:P-loop containing nucleoside triphosphate hydrolase protein [Trametopsis cervina]|nr:P-loop containing nucleoside triphosphate hydrolase protein [Trametopsis cervina]
MHPPLVTHTRPESLQKCYCYTHFTERDLVLRKPFPARQIQVSPANLTEQLERNIQDWSELETVRTRLVTFGLPTADVRPALSAFATYVQENNIFADFDYTQEQIDAIAEDLSDPESAATLDVHLTRLFFEWAANLLGQKILGPIVSHGTLDIISGLFSAGDLSDPANIFEETRAARRRKIIMHVGPTNSGKTHNALRALAAAKRGIYAGPLRLLAYEIWERLNKGQIVPLGHDAEAEAEEDVDTIVDASQPGQKPAVQKHGNPKFARLCNLMTGDDQRIVHEDADLVSCTVEMMAGPHFDVAVIDEIQLIADTERGGAWSQALLGINAREVHVCGEEAAVPLVQSLIQGTGDEFEVHRYTRLTPLTIAEESLDGDLSKIRKGDCVVAFSRSDIFKLRNAIETQTGLRCAVAYGKLPPEVRSKQAELFNDPNSGYDVLVGSDAVGMGLNLKIKRMIFQHTRKWNGSQERPLSAAQINQIAGRAGRFGLHGNDSSGGIVTAMREESMQDIRDALTSPPKPLRKARILPQYEQFYRMISAMPSRTPLASVQMAFHYVGKYHPKFELQDPSKLGTAYEQIDRLCGNIPVLHRTTFQLAPIRWREPYAAYAAEKMLHMFRTSLLVDVTELLQDTGMLNDLAEVKLHMERDRASRCGILMQKLEAIHGTLVMYLWLSYRMHLCFPQLEEAMAYKTEAETAMQWCLQKLSAQFSSDHKPSVLNGHGWGIREKSPYPRKKKYSAVAMPT